MWTVVLLVSVAVAVRGTWFQGPCSSEAQVRRSEGYNPCKHDVAGLDHICYGFNLEKSGASTALSRVGASLSAVNSGTCLTQTQCSNLLRTDMETATRCAERFVSNYYSLNSCRKSAIVDMAYNLGCGGLGGFQRMKAAIERQDWSAASAEMADSSYCRQVGCRCQANRYCMNPCAGFQSGCEDRRPSGVSCNSCGSGGPAPSPPAQVPTPPSISCIWTTWSKVGSCVGQCGSTGTIRETRTVSHSSCSGLTSRPVSCNTPACTACEFSSWQLQPITCNAKCGQTGQAQFTRYKTKGGTTGLYCNDPLMKWGSCVGDPCPPAGCVVGSWENYGTCNAACGQRGKQQQRRSVSPSTCAEVKSREIDCTAAPCNVPSVDCEWNTWGSYGECSVSCGTGQQTRFRTIKTHKSGNGKACEGKTFDTQPCTKTCSGCVTNVDCKLSDWSSWTECEVFARKRSTCGERSRKRTVLISPKCKGKACDVQHEEEACDCPSGPPDNGNPGYPGNGGGVDPNPGDNVGGGGDPNDDPTENKVIPVGQLNSGSGLGTGAYIGIVAGSIVCCLLIVALILIAACMVFSGGSAMGGAYAAEPAHDQGVHGNPLFAAQEQKAYNPLFYAGGTGSGVGGAGGVGLVSAPGSGNYASAGMPGTMGAAAGGAYPAGAAGAYPASTYGTADSGFFATAGANTCPLCQKAYPTAEDLDHHVQKRHGENYAAYTAGAYPSAVGAAAAGAYPSAAANYPSGRASGTGAALDGGMEAYPSAASNYPSAAGYGAGVADGIHTCDVCQKNYPSAADLAQHKSLRH